MKYLTKEWYLNKQLADLFDSLKPCEQSTIKDEEFYKEQYDRKFNIFVSNSKSDTVTLTPKNVAEYQFNQHLQWLLSLYNRLPQSIIQNIADMRLLALGYATEDNISAIKKHCLKLKEQCDYIWGDAYNCADEIENKLNQQINLENYEQDALCDVKETDGNVFMFFSVHRPLLIENAEIIERETPTAKQVTEWRSNTTEVCAAELSFDGGKYTISFLLESFNDLNETRLWYLTVSGDRIKKL